MRSTAFARDVGARWRRSNARRAGSAHAPALTSAGLCIGFAAYFSFLALRIHHQFDSLAWDMGIYDQAYWLVSRFGRTFITVRGLDVWGHHVNLVAYLYAPFYWLGAGPEFLVISQACVLAAGGWAVFLIAARRLGSGWLAVAFVAAYVLYSPLQWLALANYHPEALVVTPFLFAWYFADTRSWRAFASSAVLVIATREDSALPIAALGLMIAWRHCGHRRNADPSLRRSFWVGPATVIAAGAYYLVCSRIVLPHFNGGREPYFFKEFYSEWGGSMGSVVATVVRHPFRVFDHASRHDRLIFYRDLLGPLGATSLLAFPLIFMSGAQLLGSIIGASPYARLAIYQYTSTMIAPIVIASIVGVATVVRSQRGRRLALMWVLVTALVANVASSPSPIGSKRDEVSSEQPYHADYRRAVAMIPPDAVVAATYHFVPHLSRRRYVYDWPNPFATSYWANEGENPHDPKTVDWIIVDPSIVDPGFENIADDLVAPGGEFRTVLRTPEVIVARRVRK